MDKKGNKYIAINEITRPDDTRPRPQCLETEAEAEAEDIAIEAKAEAKASFFGLRSEDLTSLVCRSVLCFLFSFSGWR